MLQRKGNLYGVLHNLITWSLTSDMFSHNN